jgi:ergothioneine biosynthesis protein EgtB
MTLASHPAAALDRQYQAVRAQTEALAEGLSAADCQVQSMPDASPVRWHLAHVTWFFETFVLEPHEPDFVPHHPAFRVLFNSYYNGVGDQHPRSQRGLVTRPDLQEVMAYRQAVDARVRRLLRTALAPHVLDIVQLGLQHEQQHQELILTDLLHLLSCNPLDPAYRTAVAAVPARAVPWRWLAFEGGLVDTGHVGVGFAFDNESPRHRSWLRPYALSNRLVTQGEWISFMVDGGYRNPRWWLSAGWDWLRAQGVQAPMYWRCDGGDPSAWTHFGLRGRQVVDPLAPVRHVSLYEADAYARWLGAQQPDQAAPRLPTEAEWEHAAARQEAAAIAAGPFLESGALQPQPAVGPADSLLQLMGDAWQWTSSSYAPYPGFRAWDGAVGEYNAKFMVNQYVLRGGSCATPSAHIRASYRNFFPADMRWQFCGVRLARDVD